MIEFLVRLLITSGLLLVVAHFVRGVKIESWGAAFLGALVLGIINAVIRPPFVIVTIPLTILTLGLFLLVVNALMLWLMSALVPCIKIEKFSSAFLGALLLSILNTLVHMIID